MKLDVQTLFVAMFAAFLLFGLTLTMSRRSLPDRPELAAWATGTWCMVGAFVLLALRLVGPEWVSVIGGNVLMFVAIHLNGRALHRFVTGGPPPRWQLLAPVAGAVLITLLHTRPVAERTAVVSVTLALQGLPMVWVALRGGRAAEPSLRTVGIAVALGVVALAARTVHALSSPADYATFWQTSLGNGATYLAGYLFPLGAGIGFIVANLERTAGQLREQATYDGLTGCLRRSVFTTLLEQACRRARRDGQPLALVLLDIDHFKAINDGHGHQAGDHVLQRFAQAVRERLRASDVLGRVGGEEFAVLLPATSADGARHVAEQLRQAVQALAVEVGASRPLAVTVSAGVALLGATDDAAALFQSADAALYEAKRAGRNRVHGAVAAATRPSTPQAATQEP
ncbi:GGDEF domain-containing protein [Aquabacterium sp. J223]|uniref:GGDEF domain-containing protein n=1 Tax=Aquabacterium sp. J223 TaxID=2898431 RepID=UPI0021AE0C86|nr:GGDEF domain-containing protein [Aquabacterium sp. J223]UUX94726.1 GGDEF domain-containing protein [Aquabacterium sp. J223]